MSRPILLLDVDGVLNVYRAKSLRMHAHRDAPLVDTWLFGPPGIGLRCRWSPAVVDRLADLEVEIRWLSTWCVCEYPEAEVGALHPNRSLCPLFGWPEQGDAAAGIPVDSDYWKLRAVLKAADEGRPLVWIDDEASVLARLPPRSRGPIPGVRVPNLVLTPDPAIGLRVFDIERIETWIDQVITR